MRANEFILPVLHEGIDGFRHYLTLVNLIESANYSTPPVNRDDINYLSSLPSSKPVIGEKFSYAMSILHHDGRVSLLGSTTPHILTNIRDDSGIQIYTFDNGAKFPIEEYRNLAYTKTHLFDSKDTLNNFLSAIQLKFNVIGNINEAMRLAEGGWANPATQNTHITPQLVANVFGILKVFVHNLNQHLQAKKLPPVELGPPCGSTTYYERDLKINPTREYGDIDVNLFIPRIDGMTNNANADLIKTEVKEFCESSPDFQTSNGTNVIVKVGNDYVQVDLITAYSHNKAWTSALAPEYNVKGVLCNSIYSSLGEALQLSIGGAHGVQAKLQNGELVPFKTVKDTVLQTITTDPKAWAVDIAKFFGCSKLSPRLKAFPGMMGEIRVADMINSIRGIAETLEMNGKGNAAELLSQVKQIYLGKIQKAITSSKYEKAASPEAIKKAEQTKELLATKSAQFAKLFD